MNNDQWPSSNNQQYDYLSSFDSSFEPKQAFRPGLDTLGDGDHEFEVTESGMDRINEKLVARLAMRVDGGRTIEHIYWLNDERSINGFGADMASLGFDAHLWGKQGRSLAVEIPKCVSLLLGRKFHGTKRTESGKDSKTYHKLYVNGPLREGRPMPSLTPPSPSVQTPAPGNGTPVGAGKTDGCPF